VPKPSAEISSEPLLSGILIAKAVGVTDKTITSVEIRSESVLTNFSEE
jgi:hypothetical protein